MLNAVFYIGVAIKFDTPLLDISTVHISSSLAYCLCGLCPLRIQNKDTLPYGHEWAPCHFELTGPIDID